MILEGSKYKHRCVILCYGLLHKFPQLEKCQEEEHAQSLTFLYSCINMICLNEETRVKNNVQIIKSCVPC